MVNRVNELLVTHLNDKRIKPSKLTAVSCILNAYSKNTILTEKIDKISYFFTLTG